MMVYIWQMPRCLPVDGTYVLKILQMAVQKGQGPWDQRPISS